MAKDISLDFQFKSTIDKVWVALTDSNTLTKWMIFHQNDFKPIVGHKFQFRTEPNAWWDGIVNCEVLEVDEPHRLSYTWGEDTTVTWTLKQIDDGTTHVHLDHTGFNAEQEQAFNGALYGWKNMANKLGEMLTD